MKIILKNHIFFFLLAMPLMAACGGDDDEKSADEETSQANLEYLCSKTLWAYAPDEGIKKGESYYNYSFYRIAGVDGCTILSGGGSDELSGYYDLTYNPPTVTLKERNSIGYVNKGRSVNLVVYKLTKKGSNQSFLMINGKKYIGGVGGGIYQ